MQSATVRIFVLGLLAVVPFLQTNTYWQHVFGVALIGAILALGLQFSLAWRACCHLARARFMALAPMFLRADIATSVCRLAWRFLAAGVAAAVSSLLLVPIVKLPVRALRLRRSGSISSSTFSCSTRIG